MLVTQLKNIDSLNALIKGKVFVINCFGCKEVSFPEAEANEFQAQLKADGKLTGILNADYICNPEFLKKRLLLWEDEIKVADCVLVFSCGVGVQTVADIITDKRVYAACDTLGLPGFQGVTPLNVNCGQCGECYLNATGGICPVVACSKSLLNGPCGGTKNGKCEVNSEMDCGWERIYRRLEKLGKLDNLQCETKLRNFATFEVTKECKES